ncbi:MAG TPA: amidohydrolase family protein [Polyangia bacterium]
MPLKLVSAPWVLPIVSPPIREGAVLLDDGDTIIAVGTRAALRGEHPDVVEVRGGGALLPGLVNAHTHLELSFLAGAVPGGGGVIAWTRALGERLREGRGDTIDVAARAAAHGAKALGTVALGDVGNGTAGWRALGQAGLGGVFFHELVGSREARTGDALGDAAGERRAVPAGERPANVTAVPAPHAPYSVGPALMRRIFAAAAAAGLPTSIHLAEDPDEVALLRDGTGGWPAVLRALGASPEDRTPRLSPCAYLESLGAFATSRPPLLVHMVHADADDLRRARAAEATIVLCPRSNLHIGGRLPDVPAMLSEGLRLALGTDSLASAPDLSLWAELAALAAAFPAVPAGTWLHAATAGGARALGLSPLGALAAGRRPGLIDVTLPNGSTRAPERDLIDGAASRGPSSIDWLAFA